jgi:hypothetical protein
MDGNKKCIYKSLNGKPEEHYHLETLVYMGGRIIFKYIKEKWVVKI